MGLSSAVCTLSMRDFLDHINKEDGPTVSCSHARTRGFLYQLCVKTAGLLCPVDSLTISVVYVEKD